MGLFSFVKNAGAKLFGKKEAEAAPEVVTSEIDMLMSEINRHNLSVENLQLDIGKAVMVTGLCETNAEREKVILTVGNVDGIMTVDDNIVVTNPEPESTFHTVQSGDSLSKISKEVYGDPMRYNEIFEANKPMLSHPDKIYPGQILRIPVIA